MKPEEIKKALEYCKTNRIGDCRKCNLRLENGALHINCVNILLENALDLINQYEAEIERLQLDIAELEAKNFVKDKLLAMAEEKIENLEAEAIKEFAERFKEAAKKTEVVCSGALVRIGYTISSKNFDNLLKEMGVE